MKCGPPQSDPAPACNNPYTKIDPDGRIANFVWGAIIGGGIELGFQIADGKDVNWKSVAVAAGSGALTGGFAGVASKLATKGAITAGTAVAASAAVGGAVAASGKVADAAINGNSVTATDVAGSALAGVLGAGAGAKIATKLVGGAEKVAKSSDNIVSGMGNATLGAIREGGAAGTVTVGASELTQKGADVVAGVAGKKFEEITQ